ncbi:MULTISPECIES: hypothetical protein [Cyanophyceae]|uniref:hypothetical protein n=1 Tax=Cyanophyceae TaxID=3028117 RepID=UPI0016893018|nr:MULTISPECIES: hypothetical protein [Cyanophyceae]MBD1916157.1 hypothetical protein [Phormidium sp. FACHB-77]MBD2031574.1 hypothetical protein [Phormidium sp. FACHB-322]MBD2052799.1 hypothetical protein [Leptolyngbya sp. FACHB-60]
MPQRPFHKPGAGLEYRLLMALIMASAALVTVLLIQLLLPWLVVGGLIAGGLWFWQRQRARERALHQIFYAQVAAHQGRISVLDFAIAAQLTGSEARRFLDQRAQDFWGDFEPTPSGDVLYTFRPITLAAEVATLQVLSLTAADLAQRLGCTEAELTQPAVAVNLLAWSRDRDPDGCGWRYDAGGDRYWPVPKP